MKGGSPCLSEPGHVWSSSVNLSKCLSENLLTWSYHLHVSINLEACPGDAAWRLDEPPCEGRDRSERRLRLDEKARVQEESSPSWMIRDRRVSELLRQTEGRSDAPRWELTLTLFTSNRKCPRVSWCFYLSSRCAVSPTFWFPGNVGKVLYLMAHVNNSLFSSTLEAICPNRRVKDAISLTLI